VSRPYYCLTEALACPCLSNEYQDLSIKGCDPTTYKLIKQTKVVRFAEQKWGFTKKHWNLTIRHWELNQHNWQFFSTIKYL